MSDVVLSNQMPPSRLPDSVRRLIVTLRSSLRRYSLLSGTLLLLSMAVAVFWLTSGVDWGWFALQRLELPVGLRSLLLLGMVAGGGWLLLTHLIKPLFRRTHDGELALLLERRFPEFQDRLITTVESSAGYPDAGPLVESMLHRTVAEADDVAARVSPQDVFNFEPLRKRGWMAGVLLLSLAGNAVARPGSFERWWNAFVLCQDTYHLRTTALDFFVVAQPGERRVSFQPTDGVLRYLHPRGSDLELEMVVPAGTSEAGTPWVVPERVRVDVIRSDGTASRTYVSPTSERTFRFILTRLQESVSIEVLAGDYRTRVPLQIESVTPPGIDSLEAECSFPAYTGWNQQRESLVPIMGSEVSFPVGTEFHLTAAANKPLQSARIVTEFFEVVGDRAGCEIIPREGYVTTFEPQQPLLSEDGLSLSVPLRVTLTGTAEPGTATSEPNSSPAPEGNFLSVPSNTSLRFLLHDEDDIIATLPESLRIGGMTDKPPVIATRTSGVDNAITRRAIIPVTGMIQDEYGLASAGFQFIVDDETRWRPRPFRWPVPVGVTQYQLGATDANQPERFDVQPLELTEGQTLALAVVASDTCTIPGPNTARAEPIVFRIVSNEELLSLLYTRELNLRRRFEEVLRALEQIQMDLEFHQQVAVRIEASASADVSSEDRIGLTTCATRSGNSLRRQSNELTAIAEEFSEIIQQLLNNSIPPQQAAEKMRTDIVSPLQAVTTGPIVEADRSVSRFRVAATSGKPAADLAAESVADVSRVITELRLILENIRDMAEFHELYQEGKFIYEDLLKIWEETRELQKKRAIEKLKLFE